MKVYKHFVALLSLLLPFTVFSKEVISSDGTSNLRRKEVPSPVLVEEDLLDKKNLMQALLPFASIENIKKVAEALCKTTLDEVLDDTVYGVFIDKISYYCNAEAIGLVSSTVSGAFTEYVSIASSKNKDELESEAGTSTVFDVIFRCLLGC